MECLREKFTGGALLNGRYQTISPLNHGSFGMVFKAQDLETNQIVAIKCLTKRSAASDACDFEFAIDEKSEELVLHSRLSSHSGIVNLVDSFETEAHIYIVLEYCDQGDLYEAIRKGHGPLETEHVRQFMLELVDAVVYIHSKGVYHRDIKPENIFLSQDGSMKLGDFGLATTDKWSYEMTVGSDRYMAPEQFDSAGAGYGPAEADIWAIGICLLNILFSRNPFTTPTEADPLFLDYSRDKQSLFDVFPEMSQDTYEVIAQCMNLDPKKRSLVGARDALERVVSFTTQDEVFDDFCAADCAVMATANREPLRTPSLQSPQVDTGAFPWAKALHATQHSGRQLSAIPDESYSEDLFPRSEQSADWCSATAQTPSSMMTSNLAASMMSLAIKPRSSRLPPPSGPAKRTSLTAGSLPITMSKPLPSMSTVFGRHNETVSKSWSDMWDEDEEEEEEEQREREKALLQELNSRSWSQESTKDAGKESGPDAQAHKIKGNVDDDLVADGFFFHEPESESESEHEPEFATASGPRAIPVKPQQQQQQQQQQQHQHITLTSRYSPPKQSNVDKWAALGERRRQQQQGGFLDSDKSPNVKTRPHFGISYKSYEAGVWDHSNYHNKLAGTKDRVKECP